LCDTAVVNSKFRAWVLVVIVAVICGAAVGGVAWYRSRSLTPAALLKRIPSSDAVVIYLDFAALRRSGVLGLLDSSKVTEEPEYQEFVRKIDFNYKQDLDTVMLAFAPTGKYLLARGQFDWKSLRSYVESQNGQCYNSLCRMQGSTPDRRISFFPLQSNLLALAVSQDESAALRLQSSSPAANSEIPSAPVWISFPGAALKSAEGLPDGTRPFARAVAGADSAVLSFVPENNRVAAQLAVSCRSPQEANDLVSQLSATTNLLRQMITREHHVPNPADLSGVLTTGSFRSEGTRVFGYWPMERAFLENMFGAVQK
jgi:hypothetical protein